MSGLTGVSTLDIGKMANFMDMASTHGLMADLTKVNTSGVKNKDMEYSYGQTVTNMKVNGSMASRMAKERLLVEVKRSLEFGKMENLFKRRKILYN